MNAGSIRNLSLSQKSLLNDLNEDDIYNINSRLVKFRYGLYDLVHGHSPLFWNADKDFFTLTFLRNPVDRVVSQIMDWKRLSDEDLNALPPDNRDFKKFARENSISDLLDRWDSSHLGVINLNNMQANLLYKAKKGIQQKVLDLDQDILLKTAEHSLNEYDYVGVTESLDHAFRTICYLNQWCPPGNMPRLNSNKYSKDLDDKTTEKIKSLNALDEKLYEKANALCSSKDYSFYTTEYFEAKFAENRTRIIAPYYTDGLYLFDFNSPIIGNGFYTRDASNTAECAVWTGPGIESSLFFPVVSHCDINILLFLKGFSNPTVKDTLQIEVDGNIVSYEFRNDNNVDSVLVARYVTVRNFVHVKIKIDKTFDSAKDKRMRGVSLLKYGFNCNF
ncbi:MAG: hypothetical protein HKO66_02025 [Saprospiraceae bacterium]|nr:hypothetical protein [Bacteroidia bacterium]NNE15064.1 hypothetical protein [Saprospiraceae bacterium]NNL90989.1 hypothetical protein [Saprospiraceae bacterium]